MRPDTMTDVRPAGERRDAGADVAPIAGWRCAVRGVAGAALMAVLVVVSASAAAARDDMPREHTVYFQRGAAGFSGTARLVVDRWLLWMQANPKKRITVVGYGSQDEGDGPVVIALGLKRANAVAGYLTSQGIAGSRIKTVSFGKEKPAAAGTNETAWAKNRRVELMAGP